jgi:hypothetical protein
MIFNRISTWLHHVSTGWVALVALILFALFIALVLPAQAEQAAAESGDAGSPDSSLFYTPADLYAMAEAYGEEGRAAYVRARFTFDLIWPLVYTLFLTTSLSWLYERAFPPSSPWQYANLAPVLGALLDYLENGAASLVMLRYPARTPVVDLLAPLFTLLKWTFVGGSFVLLALGLVVALWRWFKERGD